MFCGFIDESGNDRIPANNNFNKKNRYFVEAAILVNEKSKSKLENAYDKILNSVMINNASLSEIFQVYERVTGKKPELKASYVLDSKGPLCFLRNVSEEEKKKFKDNLFAKVARELRNSRADLIVIVIDKYKLTRLMKERNVSYDPRLLALDFLFTRIAILLEKKGFQKALLVHDDTNRSKDIVEMLIEMKRNGFFYNPYFRRKPRYYLIENIDFEDSRQNVILQFADILANIVRRKHVYGEKQYYAIVAGSPWFYVRIYPKKEQYRCKERGSPTHPPSPEPPL